MRQDTYAAGVPPRIPLEEITALSRPLSWILGRGGRREVGERKGRGVRGEGRR